MAIRSKSPARIDFRLGKEQKELIERAAFVMGQTVSDFATTTLLLRARQAVEESTATKLSRRDSARFLEMLDDDGQPNAALRNAAKRYRRGG